MSRKEQDALLAFVNSFGLAKQVASFDQLADGRALMEVMSLVDATHFKNAVGARGLSSSGSSPSSENWVLKMNTLKRLHRLLLSYPLPPPQPSLTTSSLPEPPFSAIAKNPKSPEGSKGLILLVRLCLAVAVWAPANEKVIERIQGLKENDMAELMKSIEDVMETMPMDQHTAERISPIKVPQPQLSPPISNLREERDKLLQENDELRSRCEAMMEQVAEMRTDLEEAQAERDDSLARLAARTDTSTGPGVGLRSSQTGTSGEIERLQVDLAKAEENLANTEADLDKQTNIVSDLMKMVEDLKEKAAEATKLKDQLDEHRHTAERLQKSENVIEKYKKKLEESAGLRRELRNLEEENAALVNTNATLEAEAKKSGASKTLLDSYKSQIHALESKTSEQAREITELGVQLDTARSQLTELESAYERDREELQLHQERIKEIELNGGSGLRRQPSVLGLGTALGKTSLDDELEISDDRGGSGAGETKTDLKLRIRALQRELSEAKLSANTADKVAALESLLQDANKARDRYQADYLEAHRSKLVLQAKLEQIQAGKGGDNTQTAVALRQRLNEVLEERDKLLESKQVVEVQKEDIERQLMIAKTDLSLVNMDQRDILASLRESVKEDTAWLDKQLVELREQVSTLKEKDRLHLEEIKKLLMEKVDLQSSGIDQREKALERERDFGDLRAALASGTVPKDIQQQVLDAHERNMELAGEVKNLGDKLQKAKAFIRNQDALFKADRARTDQGHFEEAQKSYESQISSLKDDLERAKQTTLALEQRYRLEQQLMLSAWHELGSRTVRDHMGSAGIKRSAPKPMPTSWLGRQRRHQDEASFSR